MRGPCIFCEQMVRGGYVVAGGAENDELHTKGPSAYGKGGTISAMIKDGENEGSTTSE